LFLFRQFRSRLFQRLLSGTLLVVVTCGVIGLPFSAPVPAKNGRFPCDNCPCGCSTAEYCWDKCCCYSDTEKLQWAADNHVQPPDFLVARVGPTDRQLANSPVQQVSKPVASCCCCAKSPEPTSCETNREAEASAPESDRGKTGTVLNVQHMPTTRLVRLEDAARCHGIDLMWSVFSAVVVETGQPAITLTEPLLLFCLAIGNERTVTVYCCPDPPVP
jgi:hypothetical protein